MKSLLIDTYINLFHILLHKNYTKKRRDTRFEKLALITMLLGAGN